MHKRTITSVLVTGAALAALATANAGTAAAETHIRTYSGRGAEQACNADKLSTPYKAGSEVVLCDGLNNGNYQLSVVPNAEIPLHIAKLMVTGSFEGLS